MDTRRTVPVLERGGACLTGTAHQPHRHESDELFYLLDGEALVQVEGDVQLVTPGDLVLVPKDATHSIWPAREGETFHAFSFAVNYVGECAVSPSAPPRADPRLAERGVGL